MATVGQLVVKVGTDISGLNTGLQTAQGKLRSFGSSMRSVGAGLTLGLTAPLVGIAKSALQSAAGFEESMALIQTMSGATGTQMEALGSQALELGKSTVYSAGEAAQAMLDLTKAGMTVQQAGGAIEGVLDLAAAGGIELGDAATITANAINAFNLEATDAATVANTFAAAANASSADVGDLADGMANAGAVFAANGVPIEDLATALAIMSNNGIAGAEAGTGLKVMLQRLASPVAGARKKMEELGISIYDAQGQMLPFGDIIGQMEESLGGLSDAQRNAAMQTIFGTHAMIPANILVAQGADAYNAMYAAVTKQGAASEMADARMRGLGGAIKYFKGSIDSMLIATAMPFMQTLSNMVRGAADLLTGFSKLSPKVQAFAAVLLGVLAVGGPLLVLLGTMATAIAGLLTPVGLVIAVIVALGVAFATNFMGIRDTVVNAWTAILPSLQALWSWLQEKVAAALTVLRDWFAQAWPAIQGAVSAAWEAIQPWLSAAWSWLQEKIPAALAAARDGFVTAWEAIKGAVQTAWNAIEPWLQAAWTWLNEKLGAALQTLRSAWETAWPAIQAAVSTAWTAMQTVWTTIRDWLTTTLGGALTSLQTAWETAWPSIQSASSTAWTAMQTAWETGKSWLETNLPAALTTLQTAWESAWPAIQTAATTVWETMQTAWETGRTWLETNLPTALDTLKTKWDEVWAALPAVVQIAQETLTTIWTAMQTAWQTLVDLFEPSIQRVKDAFAGLPESFAPLGEAFAGLKEAFGSLGESLTLLWEQVGPVFAWLAMAIGAVFGVVGVTLVNGFAAVIQALGPIVVTVVDQISATISLIATMLAGVIEIVKLLIDGDWAGAWARAQELGGAVVEYLTTTWDNFSSFLTDLFGIIYDTVINTLTDLGVNAEGIVAGIKAWWDEKWGAMKNALDTIKTWVGYVQTALENFSSWLGGLSLPNPFEGLLNTLNNLIARFREWTGMGGSSSGLPDTGPTSSGGFGGGAAPSSSPSRGGSSGFRPSAYGVDASSATVAAIGRVFGAQALASASAAPVTVGPIYVTNEVDIEALAYRVATINARRGR